MVKNDDDGDDGDDDDDDDDDETQQAVTTGATNVTIASADKDLAQLVTTRVNMLNVYTGERWGPEEVRRGPFGEESYHAVIFFPEGSNRYTRAVPLPVSYLPLGELCLSAALLPHLFGRSIYFGIVLRRTRIAFGHFQATLLHTCERQRATTNAPTFFMLVPITCIL